MLYIVVQKQFSSFRRSCVPSLISVHQCSAFADLWACHTLTGVGSRKNTGMKSVWAANHGHPSPACLDLAEENQDFIQVATVFEKSLPHQSLICKQVKEVSTEADTVRLEPTLRKHVEGHGSAIELQRCTGIRLGTRHPLNDEKWFCTVIHRTRIHGMARSYSKK
jgi:hypothetical protein